MILYLFFESCVFCFINEYFLFCFIHFLKSEEEKYSLWSFLYQVMGKIRETKDVKNEKTSWRYWFWPPLLGDKLRRTQQPSGPWAVPNLCEDNATPNSEPEASAHHNNHWYDGRHRWNGIQWVYTRFPHPHSRWVNRAIGSYCKGWYP